MNVISCESLTLGYERRPVIKDISFSAEEGDFICILGENGAGKSTLMKGILSLIKPMKGKISFGINKNQIGYLPQQSDIQKDFPASVYEVVISGTLNHGRLLPFYSRREKNIAEENMKRLGIWDLKNKPYRDLSGGQQQRVFLARALCATKKLLLLDEPMAGLDPVASADFYNLLDKLNKKEGITIIMISHDIQGAMDYCKKILHLGHSKIFYGTKEEYLQTEMAKKMQRGEADA
jgi:zinc transport system ATP-binding protein